MTAPVLFRRTSDPWGRPSEGAPPLHSTRSLLGSPKPLLDAWGRPISGADAPATPPTHGLTWPGALIAYRNLWDAFVVGTIRAGLSAAQAYRTLAAGGTVDAALEPIGAAHPDPAVYSALAEALEGGMNTELGNWNQFANKADWEIMLNAGSYLQEYQRVVRQVGTRDQPNIHMQFPAMNLPEPPGIDVQAVTIGQLQGIGVVASGVLELMGMGTSGAFETMGKVTESGQKVLGAAADTVVTLKDVLPWAIGGIGLLALALIVLAGTKTGSASIGSVARSIRVVPDPSPPSPRNLDPDALVVVPSPPELPPAAET